MRTYKKVLKNIEDKVYCDICGKSCSDLNFGSEYAVVEALWGYLSKKDGKKFDIQTCEACFDELIGWMRERRSRVGTVPGPGDEDRLNGS